MEKRKWDDMTADERKKYVNQDYVALTEQLLDSKQMENIPYVPSASAFSFSSNKNLKREIILLYLNGKLDVDIAWHLNCSKQYVGKILKKFGFKERSNEV